MSERAIRLEIETLPEGGYLATSPDVPGLLAQGRTLTETVEIAQSVARKIAETCIEHGFPLPAALAVGDPTGESLEFLVPVSVP